MTKKYDAKVDMLLLKDVRHKNFTGYMKSPFGYNCKALSDVDGLFKCLSMKLFLQKLSPYSFTEQHKDLMLFILEKCIGVGHQ